MIPMVIIKGTAAWKPHSNHSDKKTPEFVGKIQAIIYNDSTNQSGQ